MADEVWEEATVILLAGLRFIWQDVSIVTALLLQIFLPSLFCCLAIHYLRRLLMRWIRSAFGWSGVLAVSWLGTPVHELSHVFVIVLSGMKITKLALFEPNKETGGLGFVRFSYNPKNPFHQIGCLLSSVAPLIGGSAAIYLATIVFFPGLRLHEMGSSVPFFGPADVLDWERAKGVLGLLTGFELTVLQRMSSALLLEDWRTYAYLYFVFSIAHNMSPSHQDLMGFPRRAGYLFAGLLVLNAPLLMLGIGQGDFYGKVLLPPIVTTAKSITSILYLSVLVSLCAAAISFPVTALARSLRR